jgi:hypothetical protein
MTLKAAYFRLRGFAAARRIQAADRAQAAVDARALGVAWPRNANAHNPELWSELLVQSRATLGLPYPAPGGRAFGVQVVANARRVYRVWRETLRYHKNVAYPHEVTQTRDAADWFLLHSRQL